MMIDVAMVAMVAMVATVATIYSDRPSSIFLSLT